MVEAGQGFVWLPEIEESPNSMSRALASRFWVGKDVPSTASVLRGAVPSIAAIEFQGVVPEVAQFDFTGRTHMKDIGILNDTLSVSGAFHWFDKPLLMNDIEIKSDSAMRANVMSLTMPPTPITGRSSTSSMGHFNLYLDSGASRNMVFDPALLINRRDPPAGTDQFVVADGVPLAVIGYGDIEMENFRIPDVYLVRGLTVNLISVGDLASSHKVCSCFAGNECNLMLPDGRQIGGAIRRDDNQYLLRFLEIE